MGYGIVLISGLVLLVSVASGFEIPEKDLRINYGKLNKHLEKNVESESPEANMAELARLYKEDSSSGHYFIASSYLEILKRFVEFAKLSADPNFCDPKKGTELAELVESGLAGKRRSEKSSSKTSAANYPLTRLHKVTEHYAYKIASVCGYDKRYPVMDYGFKLLAYDEINKRLVDELPDDEDIERNMLKAEEMLMGLGESSNGALADALRQFLKLKLTLNVEMCDERGYEILLKNDLATRRQGHMGNIKAGRRVSRIYQHYARKHEQLCRPVTVVTFKSMVKTLSPDTYRKILGLVSTKYVESIKSLPDLMKELPEKKIDDEYFTQIMLGPIHEKIDSLGDDKKPFDLDSFWSETVRKNRIFEYTKLLSQGDPDSKYLRRVVDKYKEKAHIDDDGLKRLLNKYLYQPCDEFLGLFGGLVRADDFGKAMNNYHSFVTKDTMMDELTYHTVHVGYKVCIQVKYQM